MSTVSESVTLSCTNAYIHTQTTDAEYHQDFFATPLSPYGLPVCLLGTSVSHELLRHFVFRLVIW